jgi:hypothetical protein
VKQKLQETKAKHIKELKAMQQANEINEQK